MVDISHVIHTIKKSKVFRNLSSVQWSYHFDKVKDRWLYILGIAILIYIPILQNASEEFFIKIFYRNLQVIGILPSDPFLLSLLTRCAILALFAASWDFLSGYSGQISFGHAFFLGTGSYIATFIMVGLTVEGNLIFPGVEHGVKTVQIFNVLVDLNVLYAVVLAAIISTLLAIIVGVLTLRLKGPYFALVTLVLPLIALILVKDIWEDYTGGQEGIPQIPGLVLQENYLLRFTHQYIIVLFITGIGIAILYLLASSRIGIVLKSIREDEGVAAASGVNVAMFKVVAFSISAFFASISGSLFAQIQGSSSSVLFDISRSFEPVIFTIFGGIGTISGPVVGAFLLFIAIRLYIGEAFIEHPTVETFIFALVLILILKYQPLGLVRSKEKFRNSLLSGLTIAILVSFYDAMKLIPSLLEPLYQFIGTPSMFLINTFESGLLGINVATQEGRLLIYFILGIVVGYFGPELFRRTRLKLWGVWPSLGDFEPPE